ncbi:MAG: pentapeptide repeat-containing protein [Pleurocapsa sp. CRU_1_2]|nr:pentapeptide repeat-containing protein [Pleurocapsa sp. CRU_1_2]
MSAVAKALITLCLIFCLLVLIAVPLQVNAQTIARSYLTKEILQEKTKNLTRQDGRETIDLSNLVIDLADTNSQFSQYFYQEINNTISRTSNPVNLDLSNSIVQGDFLLKQLGIVSSVGEGALSSLFTTLEQEKIQQFYPIKINAVQEIPRVNIFRGSVYLENTIVTGNIDGSNSLYLQSIVANSSDFQEFVNFDQSIFVKDINFNKATFKQNLTFIKSHIFSQAKFNSAKFTGIVDFSKSQFEASTEFKQALFTQLADFTRSTFIETVDFSQTRFRDRLIFTKSKFLNPLLLINSSFDETITFRDIYLNSLINLQDAHLFNRLDFSNAFFTPQASINVSGLAFDSIESQIIGQSGIIGNYLSVNRSQGNETVFRNLIRNFRSLEQITDANYLEYKEKQLKAKTISDRLTKVSWRKIFTWGWISLIPQWLSLNLLLLLGNYGTDINLLFSLGIITIALFSLLFWLIDRYRPHISQPVIPDRAEIMMMIFSCSVANLFSIINILVTTDRPWLTLMAIAIILLPIPMIITSLIYQRGRYHKLLDTSYFVENGEFREFRLLIGRLPIMPRFPFYRDRFMPIIWETRWNWLNYYDFSLNNIFKLGFNDIRLRDRHLPGLVAALVWYQWCLGVLYIVLLLWTLSRTIPGLNLLIYF